MLIGYTKWISGPDEVRLAGIFSDGTTRTVREEEVGNAPCVAAGGREAQGGCWGVDLQQFLAGDNAKYIDTDARADPALARAIAECRAALWQSAMKQSLKIGDVVAIDGDNVVVVGYTGCASGAYPAFYGGLGRDACIGRWPSGQRRVIAECFHYWPDPVAQNHRRSEAAHWDALREKNN